MTCFNFCMVDQTIVFELWNLEAFPISLNVQNIFFYFVCNFVNLLNNKF